MSHYTIAKDAIEGAVKQAAEAGWSEAEMLQAVIVSALERHKAASSGPETRALLEYELSNLSDKVDFDFVRSR
jgi:hypothetical protein